MFPGASFENDMLMRQSGTQNTDATSSETGSRASSRFCSCVSNIHQALDQLRGELDPDIYTSLSLLRSVRQTAVVSLDCQICPKQYLSAMQNSLALGTLAMGMVDCYEKLLKSLTVENEAQSGLPKAKALNIQGDPELSHNSSGFRLELDDAEWRSLTRRVMRGEVHGNNTSESSSLSFAALIDRLESRQRDWHRNPPGTGFPPTYQSRNGEEKHACLEVIGSAKKALERLNWG